MTGVLILWGGSLAIAATFTLFEFWLRRNEPPTTICHVCETACGRCIRP